jgi:uncharacterized membrane protein
LALPSVLIGLVAVFHLVLAFAGISLGEAQQGGWVLPPAVSNSCFYFLKNNAPHSISLI